MLELAKETRQKGGTKETSAKGKPHTHKSERVARFKAARDRALVTTFRGLSEEGRPYRRFSQKGVGPPRRKGTSQEEKQGNRRQVVDCYRGRTSFRNSSYESFGPRCYTGSNMALLDNFYSDFKRIQRELLAVQGGRKELGGGRGGRT